MKSYKSYNIKDYCVWFISSSGKTYNVCDYTKYSRAIKVNDFKDFMDNKDIINKRTVDSKLIKIMYENYL